MEMQALQALIKGRTPPEQICIKPLVTWAKQHTSTTTTEYRLLGIAVNIVLLHYLKQAQAYL